MNDEQNIPGQASDAAEDASNQIEDNKDKPTDDYYAVDDPKKEYNTTIGDGEMHNEGLVGDGSVNADNTFSEGSTAIQDEAENHDSEG
jgi:hypothetical protein